MGRGSVITSLVVALAATAAAPASAQPDEPAEADADTGPPVPTGPLAGYFSELTRLGFVDIETGSKDSLTRELDAAEQLLRSGAFQDAAVALYAIVYSPRYDAFRDFIEYQNAEYYLGVALANAGAFGQALDQLERVLARGPSAPYWGPAHRRMVDIAIDTRDYHGVLMRIESVKLAEPVPPSAAGERAYLRGRVAYADGKYPAADGELITITKKSRLYSSALYLRGLIRARRGEWRDAAGAFCEIAATGDNDRFTFVVDDRFFTIKDLARLGLGRIAHEASDYDDAYYHYFQVPDDSDKLPDALFEAAWSMYQKRELETSRDLVAELLKTFPSSPLWPEASLLGGYVELADCKFDPSQVWYDQLVAKLAPIVKEMDETRNNPHRRRALFERAITRWRETRAGAGDATGKTKATSPADAMLGLLRLDPTFVRLHEALAGMARARGEAPGAVRAWAGLARQVAKVPVGAVAGERTVAEEDAADANAVAEDLDRLSDEVARARRELDRGRRDGTVPKDVAELENDRLADLAKRVAATASKAHGVATSSAVAATTKAPAGLRERITADLEQARHLERAADQLHDKLMASAETLSQAAIERLYTDTKKVLDKARLGKIDAIIGQKRSLDIEVQDLAAGRFPKELHGRLWEQGLIGDDEEYWPFEGEYWADEYEGWR